MVRRQQMLGHISDAILHSPQLMLLGVAVLSAVCISYSSVLPYSTSRIDLIPLHHPARIHFVKLVEDFGPQNPVAVVIEGGTELTRRAFADCVAGGLKADRAFKGTVFYKIELEPMMARGPFYLDPDSLELVRKDVEASDSMIAALPDVARVLQAVNRRLEESTSRGLGAIADIIPGCARVEGLFRLMNDYLHDKPLPQRSWMSVLGGQSIAAATLFDGAGYLRARKGEMSFIFITPDKQSEELEYLVPFVKPIREQIDRAAKATPGVTASLTGIPISVLDEVGSTERELPNCTLASVIGNLIILLVGFRFRPRMAILVMLALGAGVTWTMAFAKATLGYLNLVSSVFVLFLLGNGINYGIYFATRYDLERRRGLGAETSMRKVLQEQGLGILSSALAGSLAFLALCLCPFRGFQELGLIAGFGLVFCLITATIVLPPLVLLTERFRSVTPTTPDRGMFHWIVELVEEYPLPIFLWFTFITLYASFAGDPFPFDYDLNRMLPAHAESLVAGEKLIKAGTLSPLSAIVVCKDLPELYTKERALRARPPVEMTLSWASFVPGEIERKRKILAQISERLTNHPPVNPPGTSVDMHLLGKQLQELEDTLSNGARSLDNLAYYPESLAATRAASEVHDFSATLQRLPSEEAERKLVLLGNSLLSAWRDLIVQVRRWRDAAAPDESLVPPELKRSLHGRSGSYAVIVSPREDVNQKEAFGRFHAAVSEVDPDMTGYPVIIHTMVGLLPNVLQTTSAKAILFVALLLAADLRSIRRMTLAIFPVMIGSIWLMGLMKLLGLKYNPVNFLALPMILGIGIENGVNFVHGFRGQDSAEALDTQGLGMLLSAGTSILGFEALALVSHRGLASFGFLLTLGTMSCLVATLFYLPAVVELEAHRDRMWNQFVELIGHRFY